MEMWAQMVRVEHRFATFDTKLQARLSAEKIAMAVTLVARPLAAHPAEQKFPCWAATGQDRTDTPFGTRA